MKTPVLTLLAILVAQAAASSRLVVPNAPDLMIKTRRTIDHPRAAVTTEIIYLKGARQRRDLIVESPSHADTGDGMANTSTWIQIAQCDERRTLFLNPEARTYAYEPIEDPAAAIERLRAAASLQTPSREMTIGPTVLTIDAVDTGERRRFTRYEARHVITTRTIASAPGAGTRASVGRQDGWYIDMPPMNCAEEDGIVTSFLAVATPGAPRDRVTIKQRGTAPLGYPIEETHRFGEREGEPVFRTQLVEISEAPLDDALFTVPDDYRPALRHPYGRYDFTKPDTWMNRLDAYREVVADWTNYVRHHGLRGIFSGTRPSSRY